jgi:HlyD family secretion protein
MERTTARMQDDIGTRLGIGAPRTRARLRRWILGAVLLAGILAIALALSWGRGREPMVRYLTEEVRRGDLTVAVTATGVLEPLTQVNVGTEISGTVETVAVDFNDLVRAGDVLATINTDRLSAQAQQARASSEATRAEVSNAEATLEDARRTASRLQELFRYELVPESDRDAADTALSKAEAALASARARVLQAEASLGAIEADLHKATIRSPIDGVVLDRQVDPGQTVAASFQTPVLFTLARDLSHMTLSVDVDEADIGAVRAGQDATFTVDAYPDRVFTSRVIDMRSTPKTVSGVVTYATILSADNPELHLLPGMTATAAITVSRREDALLVPNAALRFSPQQEEPPAAASERGGLTGALLPRPGWQAAARSRGDAETQAPRRVWILSEGEPVPVEVTVGPTDGTVAEIFAGDLTPGTPVLIDFAGTR